MSSGVQLITKELIEAVIEQAKRSPRRRMNYNFHASASDNPHRFLNVFLEGSYVQPHRHLTVPKAESFIVLRGRMTAFVFNDRGEVVERHILAAGADLIPQGIDLAPGVWHMVTALTPVAVCYEVKPGPWDPATDKDFAAWAPAEGSAEAPGYLENLLRMRFPHQAPLLPIK